MRHPAAWVFALWFWLPCAGAADAPFLWSHQGPKATHYFAGSVHLLPEPAELPQPLLDAVDASAVVVFESDIEALTTPTVQMSLLSVAQAPAGIRSEIGAAQHQTLRTALGAQGLPEIFCDRFRAWFCAMTLEAMSLVKSGFRAELGIDQQLHARAKAQRKPSLGLEPLMQHLGLFSGMTARGSAEFMRATLAQMGEEEMSPDGLLRLWQQNDLAGLTKILEEMKADYPLTYERLIAARNRAWVAPLEKHLRGEQPVLVVVGAAHYAGPQGLLALLRARGFVLQPVPASEKP